MRDYTGGNPLLLQQISRAIAKWIKNGHAVVPITAFDIHKILFNPIDSAKDLESGLLLELRGEIHRTVKLIWNFLSAQTKERLTEVMKLRTIRYAGELHAMGLLRFNPDGSPALGIGAMEGLESLTKG